MLFTCTSELDKWPLIQTVNNPYNCGLSRSRVWIKQIHTLYPGCNIFVYIADQKQSNTSRARMDCGKLTLFLLLQTLNRGVASQGFVEKHSVPTFMFRHK